MKHDAEGNRRWTVKADGERSAWGTFELESDADEAIASLSSPVTSLSDSAPGSKKLPVSVTPDCAGYSGMPAGAANQTNGQPRSPPPAQPANKYIVARDLESPSHAVFEQRRTIAADAYRRARYECKAKKSPTLPR